MERMLALLSREKKRIQKELKSPDVVLGDKRVFYEEQLELIDSDIDRLEEYIDRPAMQTFSELLFVDDIRLRVNRILKADES